MFGHISERTEKALLSQRSGALETWEIINHQSNRPVDLYIDSQQPAKLISLLDKGVNFERATFTLV